MCPGGVLMGDLRDDLAAAREQIADAIVAVVDDPDGTNGWPLVAADAVLAVVHDVLAGREDAAVAAVARARALAARWADGYTSSWAEGPIGAGRAVLRALDGAGDEPRYSACPDPDGCAPAHVEPATECTCPCHAEPAGDEPRPEDYDDPWAGIDGLDERVIDHTAEPAGDEPPTEPRGHAHLCHPDDPECYPERSR